MKIKTAGIIIIVGLFLLASIIIIATSISALKTAQAQKLWVEFEQDRDSQLQALIRVRSEIGYGGMIHRFKNYILRQQVIDAEKVYASIGRAEQALENYKVLSLSVEQQQAVVQIEQTLDNYRQALVTVEQLIQSGRTAKDIDDIVKVDDNPTLKALNSLEIATQHIGTGQYDEHSKLLILNALRTSVGYGGIVHDFKNYILRGVLADRTQVEDEVNKLERLVNHYRENQLNKIEQEALNNILTVMHIYQTNLIRIDSMLANDKTAREIDKLVIVDDSTALKGFNDLQREIILNNEHRAIQLAKSLDVIQLSAKAILTITIVVFLLLIIMSLWLLYDQIITPMTKLTHIMSRLAESDLDVDIPQAEYDTEIGEMTRFVELFRANAIEKKATEHTLIDLNNQLENNVLERTRKIEQNERRLALLAEQALEGEERLQILINTAMDAVIQVTDDGTIIAWNNQAEKTFGWSSDEAKGQLMHELIIPEDNRPHHVSAYKNFIATGESSLLNAKTDIFVQNREGILIQVELAASPIFQKGHYQFALFIRDITEQKQYELAIIYAKEEAEAAKYEAEAANRAKSEFLANMSHELRTPMHGILSFAAFGIKKFSEAPREKLNQYFTNIQQSGDRLLVLLNDLLDLSKLEAGKMELNILDNDLVAVLASCCREQEQRMQELGLSVELIAPEQDIRGMFDKERIGQVITNLLSNAIKFSPKDTVITASFSITEHKQLYFSLVDQGPGIPEDELVSVFNAFIQSSKTTTGAGGTGLGLAISKEIIENHHGKIWAEPNISVGAVFSFVIPQTSETI